MNLDVLHLARRIAEKHGVPTSSILVVLRGRAYRKARRELWGELHRLGCRQADIARAWGCAEKTVSEALDERRPRPSAQPEHATEERDRPCIA